MQERMQNILTVTLLVVGALLLLLVIGLLIINLQYQHGNYQTAIEVALKEQPIRHVAVLAYSRAWDAATGETSAILLAFVMVFFGGLHALRASEQNYLLRVEGKEARGVLETSSPGLAIITVGGLLVAITVLSQSSIEYTSEPISTSVLQTQPIVGKPLADSSFFFPADTLEIIRRNDVTHEP